MSEPNVTTLNRETAAYRNMTRAEVMAPVARAAQVYDIHLSPREVELLDHLLVLEWERWRRKHEAVT